MHAGGDAEPQTVPDLRLDVRRAGTAATAGRSYFVASRGRCQVVSDAIRHGRTGSPLVFQPKGTLHAVPAEEPYVTLCRLDADQLRTFPNLAFDGADLDALDHCQACLDVASTLDAE